MRIARIAEWEEYQHYSDRSPPWIKLHRKILTSRTWVMLNDKSRVLAIASMLIASDTDNKFPLDPEFFKRVAYLNSAPDFQPLIDSQFLVIIEETDATLADASKVLANDTECYLEERRGEESRGRKNGRFIPPTVAEVGAYVTEKSLAVDPERFVNFYESKGWVVGKSKMKSWKSAIAGWQSREFENKPQEKPYGTGGI